jgi:hypothetical protein
MMENILKYACPSVSRLTRRFMVVNALSYKPRAVIPRIRPTTKVSRL